YRLIGVAGLLTASLGLYTLAVLYPGAFHFDAWQLDFVLGIINNRSGAFHFDAWQLYFVLGIVLGIKYEPAISYARRRAFPLGLIALLVFVLAIPIRIALKSNPSFAENVPQWLLDRRSPLTFFRTAYVLAQLALVFLIVIRCWDRIKEWRAVHILVYWGRHSLFLFVASVFLDYAIKAFLSSYDVHFPANLLGLLGELICLHLLALAWGKLRFPLRGPGSQALQNEHR
ncbi:MAG TPA: OpgC domain-containing protein, partial [Gemmataceae bacterium]|nr:OpgC domain-containing protein [Gemmataceae bacterium]